MKKSRKDAGEIVTSESLATPDPKRTAVRRRSSLTAAIAAQILEYVSENALNPGDHLSEQKFAEAFGISRSPVRSALKLLAQRKLAVQEPNRGYFLAASQREVAAAMPAMPPSEENRLYHRIAAARIDGELPDHVTEADLVRTYDVPRSQLVRVLTRMVEDGLLQRAQGRGWRFQPAMLTVAAHDESYRFRLIIESSGFDEPTFEIDDEKLAQLRRQSEQMMEDAETISTNAWLEVNARFHETIASLSGNRYIHQAVQQQNRLRRLLEVKGLRDANRVRESCSEHLEIIAALERGDRWLAKKMLVNHLQIASNLKLGFERNDSKH